MKVVGSGGVRASALSVVDEIAVLVDFPVDDVESPSVDFGAKASGDEVVLVLPATERSGLALARYDLRGRLLGAELIATSSGTVSGLDLQRTAESYRVGGTFSGTVTFDTGDRPAFTMTTERPQASFSIALADRTGRADYLVENGSDANPLVADRVIVAGSDCVAFAVVQGGRSATVAADGQVRATVATSDTLAGSNHLVWLPACGQAATAMRELRSTETGAVLALHVAAGPDGAIAIGGAVDGPFEVVGGDGEPMSRTAREHVYSGFIVTFGAALATRGALVIGDTVDAPAFVLGLAEGADGGAAAFSVAGQATIDDGAHITPVAGNPGVGSTVPRAVVMRFASDGMVRWTKAEAAEKDVPFEALALEGDRVLGFGSVRSDVFGSAPPIDVTARGGYLATAYADAGRVWGASLAADSSADGALREDPLLMRALPGTRAMVVAGTIGGPSQVGGAYTVDITGPAATVFLARINSEDGIGCPTE